MSADRVRTLALASLGQTGAIRHPVNLRAGMWESRVSDFRLHCPKTERIRDFSKLLNFSRPPIDSTPLTARIASRENPSHSTDERLAAGSFTAKPPLEIFPLDRDLEVGEISSFEVHPFKIRICSIVFSEKPSPDRIRRDRQPTRDSRRNRDARAHCLTSIFALETSNFNSISSRMTAMISARNPLQTLPTSLPASHLDKSR